MDGTGKTATKWLIVYSKYDPHKSIMVTEHFITDTLKRDEDMARANNTAIAYELTGKIYKYKTRLEQDFL